MKGLARLAACELWMREQWNDFLELDDRTRPAVGHE